MNYLHFFGAGRILRIRQRQHSPDSLRLIYFCAIIFVTFFTIIICIIYYCLRLIGYVLIFCFFCELKFKLKFVRWFFFWRRNGIGDGFERLAGRIAPSWERSDRRTRRAPDRNCCLAFTARCFSDKLSVDAARRFQSSSVSISTDVQLQPAAHSACARKRAPKFIHKKQQPSGGDSKEAGQTRRGRNKLAKSFAWEI